MMNVRMQMGRQMFRKTENTIAGTLGVQCSRCGKPFLTSNTKKLATLEKNWSGYICPACQSHVEHH